MLSPSYSDVNNICIYCRCYWHPMVLPLVKSGQLYYHLKLMVTFLQCDHMTMEMSVRSMKSNSVSGIMAEYPDIVTYRKTSLEKISPQLSICSIKLSLFHSIFLLIAVVKSTFLPYFPQKLRGNIF